MSDDFMKIYRQRWQAVAEVERQEQQSVSMDRRWGQLDALFSFTRELELQLDDPDVFDDAVILRWARLKDLL